jgi:hypothetical protein
MNENPHPRTDPLEDWLVGQPALTPPGDLEQAVLRRTQSVLRRRRWLRRTASVAALAACYVAGLLTIKVLPSPQPAVPTVIVRTDQEPKPPITLPREDAAPPKSPSALPASPLALEWQAVDSREKRPDLYRQAGDRYLQENGDVQSAVRCYRNMLEAAPEEAAAISADDNWLLMALKDAKQKEKRRGKSDG